ncbi:MAG: AI-2E family transporter [Oscillospiraceae bacterium]|nr:AI-2E family transporter [Oscillospiraceae bacterium]
MKTLKKYSWILVIALGVLVIYKILFDLDTIIGVFGMVLGIINPFIIGFIIAFCINIPVSWLEGKILKIKRKWVNKFARSISIFANCTLLLLLLGFGLSRIIPMIYENVMQLIGLIPEWFEQGLIALKNLPFADELNLNESINDILETQPWMEFLSIENIDLWGSVGMVQSVFSGMMSVILTAVSAIYFLIEYNGLKEYVKRVIKAVSKDDVRQYAAIKYVRLVEKSFRKFLSCQFLDSLILGTIVTIEFLILGSPYALVLGILLGVLNIIPYFGSIFGSLIAILITLFTNGLETAILTAVILLITQQIDGNFINPKIMGTSFKVSPILVIISISIGAAMGGILGMIFAVPVANVIKTVFEEHIHNREKVKAGIPIEYDENGNEIIIELEPAPVQEKAKKKTWKNPFKKK